MLEIIPDEDERRWIEPCLASLIGLGDAPGVERDELFNAWRTFFERISASGTVVMVFEDLQWADPGLIDFVESILEWSRAYPILVVTLSRPELLDTRPDWGAGQRSFTSIHLEALGDDDMRALLAGVVAELPEVLTARILQRAEGVPLYAVETVRMLVDRGVLVDAGGGLAVTGEVTELEMPETLHALLASRLDSLSGEQRALLQDAAVLGTSFLPETLARCPGSSAPRSTRSCATSCASEFLSFDTDPRSPERGQYGFVQAVIADVALAMLSRRDLFAKHLAAARYYESLDDEELTPVVARHFAGAHRVAPDPALAAATAADAQRWLRRAAERAMALGSTEQAAELAAQALDVTPPGAEHASLLLVAAEAALRAGKRELALEQSRASSREYRDLGDATAAGVATARSGAVLRTLDRFDEGVEACRTAFDELGDDGDVYAKGLLAQVIAECLNFSGRASEALEWAEEALASAERTDDWNLFFESLGARSFALYNVGRHQEAALLVRGAIAQAQERESIWQQARASMSLSLYSLPDDVNEAFRVSLVCADFARRAGVSMMEETALLNAVETGIGLGRWREVEPILADVVAGGATDRQWFWIEYLQAMLLALHGDVAAATAAKRDLEARVEPTAYVMGQTTVLTSRAFVDYFAGEFESGLAEATEAIAVDPTGINSAAAIAHAARCAIWLRDEGATRAALASAGRIRGRYLAALRAELEAALAALSGDPSVDRLFTDAVEAWRAVGNPLDIAITELEAVHLLGSAHPVASMAKEAIDILTELEVPVLLDRVREAMA